MLSTALTEGSPIISIRPISTEGVYPIDLQDFRYWLSSFTPSDVVGWSQWGSRCPLKNYFASKDTSVTRVSRVVERKGKPWLSLDFKALKILVKIDYFNEGYPLISCKLTAKEVLSIVDSLYPGLERESKSGPSICGKKQRL